MSFINEQLVNVNGLSLHTVSTSKFKTNTIVLKLLAPLNDQYVTYRALLPYVLQRGTKSFPTSTSLRQHLDELYGATLHVDLAKKGENHIISFRMELANEKFLSNPAPLLEKGIKLLSEILLDPVVDGEAFKDEIVTQEKRTLKQRIQSVYDDKMRYSNLRLVQEMCKGEPYALHVNGDIEDIEQISPQTLFDYYQKAISSDKIDLYVVGDLDQQEVEGYVKRYFPLQNNHQPVNEAFEKQEVEENEVIEEQDVKQGKLNIGYRTNSTYRDDDYYALQVFNGIYGGFSHSKLFINVREKASLAYYAASRVESHKGLLMVMSGIEVQNYDQAVTIIREQMAAMKSGDFTDQEFEQTKAVIRNQLLETIDTAYGLVEIVYHNVIAQKNRSFDEYLQGIEKVSKEDVVKVADKVELDTIYFLKGMGGNA
ncbi:MULTISPECIES: EF-P 5-aminopentanol modification-associated protein YfmF [Metabacillus]|uniref:Zinc protease n=2 Tax=Metabacillus TaxID=2675233 RepID=A0A179SP70_9BACI|nr:MULTISPECIES: pitrilysin family protein [Metabacillus]OAS83271.1 zinc protease [Metabacillus litoralis]QNF29593.1 insulinase family protein [Metabacillus sp. KUDC1714]